MHELSRKYSRAALLSGLAAAASLAALPHTGSAQELTKIRVGASLDDGLTPVLYGIQAGLYKKVGLEIEMIPSGNGAALATAAAGGAVEFAKSSTMALITAYSHGVFFKMVSGAATYRDNAPATQLSVLKDSPIRTYKDLAGKTITVNALLSLDMIGTRALIDKNGGNSADSKYIEMPGSAMLGALEQGRCDMAAITEPSLTNALKQDKIRTFAPPYRGIGKSLLIACWFCSTAYAKSNRDVVDRFAKATRAATFYANAHHAETLPLIAAYSHLNADVISQMTRVENATELNVSQIQPAIDMAVKYNLIPKGFSASEFLL